VTEWYLDTRLVGKRVLVFPTLASTNDHAAALAEEPANAGLVVLAAEQSAGRGQHGRTWQCPAETGVLLSVLLFPPPQLRRVVLLTAWAAVSVCHAIERLAGAEGQIKWPNDILVHGKKVAGILIEQGRGTVAGIGLNLNQTAAMFEQAGLPDATSLSLAAGREFSWEDSARHLIHVLDEEYDRLLSGDMTTLEDEWNLRLGLLGRQVEVACLNGVYSGQVLECTFSGLSLYTDERIEIIVPEKVRQVSVR
jgi:BirA family biotin operon repressor/biotin-[acetyl-CoA-carboxylase] ligase